MGILDKFFGSDKEYQIQLEKEKEEFEKRELEKQRIEKEKEEFEEWKLEKEKLEEDKKLENLKEIEFHSVGRDKTLEKDHNWKFNRLKFLNDLKKEYSNHELRLSLSDLNSKVKGGVFDRPTNWYLLRNDLTNSTKKISTFEFGFGGDDEGVIFFKDHEVCLFLGRTDWNYFDWDSDDFQGRENNFKNVEIRSFFEKCKSLYISQYTQWKEKTLEKLGEEEKEINDYKTEIFKNLDKDGNGLVDITEGNDLSILLKKHQNKIININRDYLKNLVKISYFLKTKKNNIQSIFSSIREISDKDLLHEYVKTLEDDIHSYNLVLFNSLNMVVSLVEDEMITFYEIYEMFDNLNLFDSKHQKDISENLKNIGYNLNNLIQEIQIMSDRITNTIQDLSYVTEQSNQQLSSQLDEINSSVKVGNFINSIQTYQLYKINKQTKGLTK
tara:strand:+ start:136 stop:1455 length:1320 start_codon:yes stop_codon:yes gene_type:complete